MKEVYLCRIKWINLFELCMQHPVIARKRYIHALTKHQDSKKNVYMIQIKSVRIFHRRCLGGGIGVGGGGVVCKDIDSRSSAPSQDDIFLKPIERKKKTENEERKKYCKLRYASPEKKRRRPKQGSEKGRKGKRVFLTSRDTGSQKHFKPYGQILFRDEQRKWDDV